MKRKLSKAGDDNDRQVIRDVAESGCHIGVADETGPAFAYSVGCVSQP